jgi:hypothetical protein
MKYGKPMPSTYSFDDGPVEFLAKIIIRAK